MLCCLQCIDRSMHFAAFGVARHIRCQETGDSDGSLLGANLPHRLVNISRIYFMHLWHDGSMVGASDLSFRVSK